MTVKTNGHRKGPGRPCTVCEHPDDLRTEEHIRHALGLLTTGMRAYGPCPPEPKSNLLAMAVDLYAGMLSSPRPPGMAEWAAGWLERLGPLCEHVGRMRPTRSPVPITIRRTVLERDNHRCVWCGMTERLQMDHVLPWSAGGKDTSDNLQTLCGPCNLLKWDHLPGDIMRNGQPLGLDGRPG